MLRSKRLFAPGLVSLCAIALGFSLVTLSLVPGCASNPVATAQTVDQKAYAVYGTFVVAEESAAALEQDPQVSTPIKRALSAADATAKPSADALLQALKTYENVKAEVDAGATPADKLALVTANLDSWLARTTQDIKALVSVVHSADHAGATP